MITRTLRGIAAAGALGLASAALGVTAYAAPEIQPPVPKSGVQTQSCAVTWDAETILDERFSDPAVTDSSGVYSNRGYVYKVKSGLSTPDVGRYEIEHWVQPTRVDGKNVNKLMWRIPIGTKYAIDNATVRMTFTDPQFTPDQNSFTWGHDTDFERFTSEYTSSDWAAFQKAYPTDPNVSNYPTPYDTKAATVVWGTDAQGHTTLTVKLGAMAARSSTIFWFSADPKEGVDVTKTGFDLKADLTGTYPETAGAPNCPAPASTPSAAPSTANVSVPGKVNSGIDGGAGGFAALAIGGVAVAGLGALGLRQKGRH